MDIPKRIRPLRPTQIVDDASFQGAHDTNLSRQAAAYALRACGNVAHFHYHTKWAAPEATIAALATWYTFDFNNDYTVTFEVPWHHQSQHTAIAAELRVVSQGGGMLSARLQSDQLIDAVASTEGGGIYAMASESSGLYGWRQSRVEPNTPGDFHDGSLWKVMTFRLRLSSPTLPANRRILVRPQVSIDGLAAMVFGTSDADYYVESFALWDEPDPDTNA